MDSLCDSLNSIKMIDYINVKLISDLNIIIREISRRKTLDVDIYELCISCGNDVVWTQEYFISIEDINWLNSEGKKMFLLNLGYMINTNEDFIKAENLYNTILELFSQSI